MQLAGDRGQVKRKYDENLNAWTNQSSPKFAKMEAPDEPFNSIRQELQFKEIINIVNSEVHANIINT